MSKRAKTKEISYEEALSKLEAILENIRTEKINLDELAEQLKESSALVRLCQEKIHQAETEVKRVDQNSSEK